MPRNNSKKTIIEPVVLERKDIKTGDIITITPSFHGNKGDLCYSDNGYVYIIKRLTAGEEFVPMRVRVTAKKDKYGFVEFMERLVQAVEESKGGGKNNENKK